MNRAGVLASGFLLGGLALFQSETAIVSATQVAPIQTPRLACTESQSLTENDFLFPVKSLDSLVNSAKIIVEASVQSTAPSHALLVAANVLKGPRTLQQFVVSHEEARGLFEMRPGQRFILFLSDDKPGIVQWAQLDVPHYGATGELFCIDNDRIRLSASSGLRSQYEGATLQKAKLDIQSYLSLPR